MNEEFAQWVYKRAFYIIHHPNDFTAFQYYCAWEFEVWYAEEYCAHGDKSSWIPDGAIEVVCKAFDFSDASVERRVNTFHDLQSSHMLRDDDDGEWFEPDFGDERGGYKPVYAYIGDLYECKADILSDLEELRAAGECEGVADPDLACDEYRSMRDCDHDLDADLTYFEGAGVL